MTASAHPSGVETCGSSRRRNASAVASAARAVADAAAGRVLARHRQRIAGELAEAGGVEAAAAGPGSAGADAVGRAIDRVRPRAPLLSLPSGPPRAPLEPLSRSSLALRQRTGAPLGG